MKFKDFKEEIIDRCKKKGACEDEFERVLDSKSYKELIPVLTDNFCWSCNNRIIDIDLMSKVGNEILNKYDLAFNCSIQKGYVLLENSSAVLRENSSAVLLENSSAVLLENSSAVLLENSSAVLRENSSAELRGNSSAVLLENSSAVLRENSSAVLWENSSAVLRENSSAELRENSSAVLLENSSAVLWENSYINSHNTIEHRLNDKSICRYVIINKIVISGDMEIKRINQ